MADTRDNREETMDTMVQRFIRERDGSWTVKTYYGGHLRHQMWTLGTKREVDKEAREARIEVFQRIADEIGG
jgi:hypothetical protein